MRQVNLKDLADCGVNIVVTWVLAEENVDGKGATWDSKDGNVSKETRELHIA
jgi:hypothetical protein